MALAHQEPSPIRLPLDGCLDNTRLGALNKGAQRMDRIRGDLSKIALRELKLRPNST